MLALKALVLCFFPSFTFMGEEDIPTVVPNWPTSHLERLWLVFCGPTLKLFTVLEINTCVLFAFLHERVRQKGRWRQAERHRETDTVTGTPRGGDAENRGGTVAPAAARGEASLWTEDPSCPCLLPLSTVSQKRNAIRVRGADSSLSSFASKAPSVSSLPPQPVHPSVHPRPPRLRPLCAVCPPCPLAEGLRWEGAAGLHTPRPHRTRPGRLLRELGARRGGLPAA